jgi:hypothetical protein
MKALITSTLTLLTIGQIHTIYFDVQNGLERCYVEEFFQDSTALIKYKVFTHEKDGENYIKQNLDSIFVNLYDEYGRKLASQKVTAHKDKFSVHIAEDSYYRVCVEANGGSYEARGKIFVRIKIASDNMEEPDISKAIKQDDVNNLHEELRGLIRKGDRVVKHQVIELTTEDGIAKLQMADWRLYFGLTVMQIVIIGLVFLYNVYSFVRILRKNFV